MNILQNAKSPHREGYVALSLWFYFFIGNSSDIATFPWREINSKEFGWNAIYYHQTEEATCKNPYIPLAGNKWGNVSELYLN